MTWVRLERYKLHVAHRSYLDNPCLMVDGYCIDRKINDCQRDEHCVCTRTLGTIIPKGTVLAIYLPFFTFILLYLWNHNRKLLGLTYCMLSKIKHEFLLTGICFESFYLMNLLCLGVLVSMVYFNAWKITFLVGDVWHLWQSSRNMQSIWDCSSFQNCNTHLLYEYRFSLRHVVHEQRLYRIQYIISCFKKLFVSVYCISSSWCRVYIWGSVITK